jgi:hypothetical protein
MARAKSNNSTANLGFEAKLWLGNATFYFSLSTSHFEYALLGA